MVEKVEQRGKVKQCLRSDFELKQPQQYRSDGQTKSLRFYSASLMCTVVNNRMKDGVVRRFQIRMKDGRKLPATKSVSKTPQNQQKEKGETKKEKGEENQQ
jgi:hypothetical protein